MGNFSGELQSLIRFERPQSVSELRAHLFPATTRFFGALRGGLFLLAEAPGDVRFSGNPVVRALIERHAPLHELQVVSAREWRALQTRADHGHVLVGPLVANGELVGALGFTRGFDSASFDEQNVSDLSALCLHVSTQMISPATHFDLTRRERDIVALVAKGQTNAQIGRALCVSSETVKAALKTLFRKVGVRSRAELVATLARPKQADVVPHQSKLIK